MPRVDRSIGEVLTLGLMDVRSVEEANVLKSLNEHVTTKGRADLIL